MSDPFVVTPPTHPSSGEVAPPIDPRLTRSRSEPPTRETTQTPQSRRTTAIVVTSLGALLLAAAATVFMVIAWDRLRLPAKVGVVGVAAVACLGAGHLLRRRLSGVAAVLTHLGAVLTPLVAGAGGVALDASRPLVAVASGVVGVVVLETFDRMRSKVLAAGRALAIGGVAVGLGVWLDVSPAILLVVAAAGAGLLQRWDESTAISILAASTPLIGWGADFAQPGSLLLWIDVLSAMDSWLTSAVAVASLVVLGTQVAVSQASRSGSTRARWVATAATAVFAINIVAFTDSALAHPDRTLLILAISVVGARGLEAIWNRPARRSINAWAWLVTAAVWTALLAANPDAPLQMTELVASVLLLASWLLADVIEREALDTPPQWRTRLLQGSSDRASGIGILVSALAIATAGDEAAPATIGLLALAAFFAVSRRHNRAELTMMSIAGALVAAVGAPHFLPAVTAVSAVLTSGLIIADLRRGRGPRTLQPIQWLGLTIGGLAVMIDGVLTGPSWLNGSIHLAAFAIAALAVCRLTTVPDLLLPPRFALALPAFASLGDLRVAGVLALVAGTALIIDRMVHKIAASEAIGCSLLTMGSWVLAAEMGITAPEAYVALPCLILLKLGYVTVERGGSSWPGMASAVGLFTMVGLIERIEGGPGWHAVGVGACAIVAMVVGVDRRWAGPSLVGAVALLCVVGVETAAYVPAVPLWVWLALGGAFLVGAGAHLERGADGEGIASLKTAWAGFR